MAEVKPLGTLRWFGGLCCLLALHPVAADPITWEGEDAATAYFDIYANWRLTRLPGIGDTAIVPADAVVTPILRTSQTIGAQQAPGGLRLNAILTVNQAASVTGMLPWGSASNAGAETIDLATPPGLVVSSAVVAHDGHAVLSLTITDILPEFESEHRQDATVIGILNLLSKDD
jgi:hypothetical protein